MKKTAILSLLFFAVIAFGQGIKFEEGNFKSLLAKAKKENKTYFYRCLMQFGADRVN